VTGNDSFQGVLGHPGGVVNDSLHNVFSGSLRR
jgi:hypothetical protein